jgi:hypothetical protein
LLEELTYNIIQLDNDLPEIPLEYKPSSEILNNRIGTFWDLVGPGDDASGWNETMVFDVGFTHSMFCFQGMEQSLARWNWPELSIDSFQNSHVTHLADNGVALTFNLTFWDTENHPDGWDTGEGYSRFQFGSDSYEEEIQRYIDYINYIVPLLKDRVEYFELWNEPDNQGFPAQYIKPPDYIKLVKRVAPVIKEIYPEAKIVVGSSSGLRHSKDWLFSILNSDEIMPLVDVVSWHPFFNDSPAWPEARDYYYQYPSIVQAIIDTTYAHGFRGEYRACSISYWESRPEDPVPYSAIESVKYELRAVLFHLGRDMTTIVGSRMPTYLSYRVCRYLCTVMEGNMPKNIPVRIQCKDTTIRSYGFTIPGDRKMIALWTDEIAVNYDPGVQVAIKIPGFIDKKVYGIDVLHGFEQELITEVETDSLVIHNLLIKDYPIILRIQ